MNQDNRIHFLDALRGYALMGLFLIHMIEYFELYWRNPPFTSETINTVLFGIFGGKAYAIFAFLFGISFFIILNNHTKRGVDFRLRFLWRLTILFGIGYLHALIYGGEVLQILALCGLLLIPLWAAPGWLVLLVSLIFLLQVPAWALIAWINQSDMDISRPFFSMYQPNVYDVYATGNLLELFAVNSWQGNATKWLFMWESGRLWTICGLSTLGFLLARLGFFADFKKHESRFRWGLVILAVLFSVLHFGQEYIATIPHVAKTERLFFGIFGAYENLTITLFSVCAFLVLYHLGGDKILRFLAPPGRMTLSIYVSQSIIGVFIFYGCGLNGWAYMGQMNSFLLGVLLWMLQIGFAIWWFKHFRFGPLEWLWRAATYTSLNIPFKK